MDEIIVRKASEADKSYIAGIIAFGFENIFSVLIKDMEKVARALENGIDFKRFFVAEINREIIGVIACTDCDGRAVAVDKAAYKKYFGFIRGLIAINIFTEEFMKPFKYPKTTGYIEFVAVAEKARRKGVASKMLRAVIDNTNYNDYLLDVTDVNTGAQECYKSFGFKEIERVKEKHGRPKGFNARIYIKYSK
jgi:ribosomal protein S18 acetylase RimI-like enzyme